VKDPIYDDFLSKIKEGIFKYYTYPIVQWGNYRKSVSILLEIVNKGLKIPHMHGN
jgi:hypothetical protein